MSRPTLMSTLSTSAAKRLFSTFTENTVDSGPPLRRPLLPTALKVLFGMLAKRWDLVSNSCSIIEVIWIRAIKSKAGSNSSRNSTPKWQTRYADGTFYILPSN